MANPNILNVSAIFGNTVYNSVTTSFANSAANPSNSSSVYKVVSLIVSNYSSNAYNFSAQVSSSGSNTYIINNAVVPANASITILGKDNPIYLLENTAIQVVSNYVAALQTICSFEQIS
jgi:hypothetical protein